MSSVGTGRGFQARQDDSSSSRESSPLRRQKRSFSPTSDDGDLVIPPIADDDTPPPPERPILRQPVGFAWDASSSIINAPVQLKTYQASISPPSTSSGIHFLPGQEVPAQSIPEDRVPSKKKSTKKRRTNEYSSQTSRFRLSTYTPMSYDGPPTHNIGTPNNTMPHATYPELRYPAISSPTPTLTSSFSGHSGSDSTAIIPQATFINVTQSPARSSTKSKETKTAKSKNTKPKPTKKTKAIKHTSPADIPPENRYYRRDYNRPHEGHDDTDSPLTQNDDEARARIRATLSHPVVRESLARYPPAASLYPQTISQSDRSEGASEPIETGARRIARQLRMVTLLIQDLRSGTTDHQLAEVKIPLKDADDPQDGFWADAKELSEKLQGGPSRIDGPAKAFTLRGKYRQFFLRVTAENVDEYISANLVVRPDRTMDVVVEMLLPPGTLPPPPQIPRELRSRTPDAHEFQPHWSPSRREQPSGRGASTSLSNHGGSEYEPHQSNHSSSNSARDISSRTPSPLRQVDLELEKEHRGYESPDFDDSPEDVHELVSKATDSLISQDPEWIDFFRSKGAPQRAYEVVKQYRIFKRIVEEYTGKRAPFKSHRIPIETSHILQALKIDDPNYESNCMETLRLLGLYGPEGERLPNSRVIETLNDNSIPGYNAKPIKRLLHLLQEVDDKWRSEHSIYGPEGAPKE